jgi:hypothetical protein
MRPTGLTVTKIDESNTFGNLLNVLIRTKMHFSYITDGQLIPDNIEAASIERLVDLILVNKKGMDPLPELSGDVGSMAFNRSKKRPAGTVAATRFVANRNSDIYHVAGCKWTKKIKPDNIITFESAWAAEQKNYLPCRNCNPTRLDYDGTRSFERDKINIALFR